MEGEDTRTTRTSDSTAEVTPFAEDAALLAALFAAVSARVAAAIAHRQWIGLLSRRGDAASALFLDGERVAGLLEGPAAPPPAEVVTAATAAEHVVDVLAARLAGTPEAAGPLTRALKRWQLDPASILLLGALLAAELSPRLARVLAYLGGDASRPGVTVDAAAALVGDGVPGALIVDARTSRGAPLFELGLVAARPLDQPLLRRTLGLAPRVIQLARGELALDPALAHQILPALPAAVATPPALEARITAVLRAAPPVIGLVRGPREASAAERIAEVAARRGGALWQLDVRALADEGIERAVIREAVLLDAALLIRIDAPGPGREAWRVIQLIDRLAARVPTFVEADDRAELEPRWSSPVIPIELPALADDERVAVWTEALGPGARFVDLERARRVKIPVAAMRRTAGALAAVAGGVPLIALTIAQVMREPALPRLAPRALDELVVSAALRDRVLALCNAARRSDRTILAIIGRAGSGKTALAAAIAGALETAAVVLDFAGAVGRVAEIDRGLTELGAFAAAGGTAVIDAGDAVPQRRGVPTSPEVELLGRWLAAATGVVIVMMRDAVAIDPVVRRAMTEVIELPAPDAAGRDALGQAVAKRSL